VYYLGFQVKNFGSTNVGTPWCFIVDSNWYWALFYVPVGVSLVVGGGCMVVIIGQVIRSSLRTNKDATLMNSLKAQGRPVGFILMFAIVWGVLFSYRLLEYRREDMYLADTLQWVHCVLIDHPSTGVPCTTKPEPYITFWLVVQAILGGVGFWNALLWTTSDHFGTWRDFLLCREHLSGSDLREKKEQQKEREKRMSKRLSKKIASDPNLVGLNKSPSHGTSLNKSGNVGFDRSNPNTQEGGSSREEDREVDPDLEPSSPSNVQRNIEMNQM